MQMLLQADPTSGASMEYFGEINGKEMSPEEAEAFLAWLLGAGLVILAVVGIGLLLYHLVVAFFLMKIAQRLKMDNAWLAWIPFVNLVLVFKMGNMSPWLTLIVLGFFVPIPGINVLIAGVCSIALIVVLIVAFIKIAEKLRKPAWMGVLSVLFAPINLIFMGILAYGKEDPILDNQGAGNQGQGPGAGAAPTAGGTNMNM